MEEKIFNLQLTELECQELQRTLMGRDLDITNLIKEAMKEGSETGDTKRVLELQKMKDANQSVFTKLLNMNFTPIL